MVEINRFGFILSIVCLCATLLVKACHKINTERVNSGLEPQFNPETLNNCSEAIFYTLIATLVAMYINGIALIWQN